MSFCAPPRAKSWRPPQCSLASLARVPKVTPSKKILHPPMLSPNCLNSLLPSSRLHYSMCSFRSRGHQFSLAQLNTVLYKNMFVKRCLFQYILFHHSSSPYYVFCPHCVFSPRCIVCFLLRYFVKGADVTFIY